MKILQLIYESLGNPFGFGGAGVRAYEIYRRLKDRHDITLVCMKYPGARDCEVEGLRHIFLGTESRSLTKSVLAYTAQTANFVRKHGAEFDVIIENFLPSTPFFSRFLAKTPVILQVQGIMEFHSLKKFNLFYSVPMYIVEKFYPLLFKRFIFVSEVTREKVIGRACKDVRQCSVIPNGVDNRFLMAEPADGNYILFFSRIDVYTKGIDILLKAFEKISPAFPELRLVFAGYEFDRFDTLVSGCSLAVRRKIEYAGFVTGDEKIRLLSGARLFVLPSRHESSPISILEAAACGKPVLVSDIPELSFVGTEHIGLTFRAGIYESLAEKITELLNDRNLREALGRNARQYAGGFHWDRIAPAFENFLQETVGKAPQHNNV